MFQNKKFEDVWLPPTRAGGGFWPNLSHRDPCVPDVETLYADHDLTGIISLYGSNLTS